MMPLPSLYCLLVAAALHTSSAAAHSHIDYVLVNGVSYPGYIPQRGSQNPPDVVGWSTTATDDGFVPPSNYTTPDIVCHRDGAPPRAHVPVSPGDRIHFQWNGWPQSHDGPVQSYLAPCDASNANDGAGCAGVDKTRLEFFKIDDSAPALLLGQKAGAAGARGPPGGLWATDVLIANNNSWLVEVPAALAPGPYVLRHEIIALHYAGRADGAQNYPQCFNIWVAAGPAEAAGPGPRDETGTRRGVPAAEMYHADDPGILIDIYGNLTAYDIPGPALAADAVPIPVPSQTNMLLRAVGTPVLVLGNTTVPFPQSSATAISNKPFLGA